MKPFGDVSKPFTPVHIKIAAIDPEIAFIVDFPIKNGDFP